MSSASSSGVALRCGSSAAIGAASRAANPSVRIESYPAGPATREESRVEAASIEPAIAVTGRVHVAPASRVGARLEWTGGDPTALG